jgi:hypothetical protein
MLLLSGPLVSQKQWERVHCYIGIGMASTKARA